MQTSELAINKNHLLGDEECINFRPSPNFKHMKKYMKSKFEEANSSPNHSSDHSSNSEEHESIMNHRSSPIISMAQQEQPPLPPNSPPPEYLVVPKQEVEDEDYNDRTLALAQQKADKVEVAEKQPEKTMCRQFARGMCGRGATCIYVHELILSQLPGVYTFCKNFQNSICNFPKCKFVHASVFEKEHFYRTGYLPPHTLIHLKESNSALGPPTALEGTPATASPVISSIPTTMHQGVVALPTSGSASDASSRPNGELLSGSAKRDWTELAIPTHEQNGKPIIKKCKTCDLKELRLQNAKDKINRLKDQAEATATQHLQWLPRFTRINTLIDNMLKSRNGALPPISDNILNLLRNDNNKDNEMTLFKQMMGVVSGTKKNAEQQRDER